MHSLGLNMLVLTQHTNLSNIFADLSTNKIKQIPTMICAIYLFIYLFMKSVFFVEQRS